MITVGDFYEDLRVVLARGNTTDERLKVWSRVALRFLEREFTFDYQKDAYLLLLPIGSNTFNIASHDPPIPLKEIEALGYYGSDGGMVQWRRRNVSSRAGMTNPLFNTYRTQGSNIIFEGMPDAPGLTTETMSYPLLLYISHFTEWPSDPDEGHPLLEIADDLLKYQVLLSSTPSLRKQSELQGWKFMRDEAITGLRRLEDSKELEDDVRMEYMGGHTGNLFSSASEAIASICGTYDIPQMYHVIGGMYLISCGMGDTGSGGNGAVSTPHQGDHILLESGEMMALEDETLRRLAARERR